MSMVDIAKKYHKPIFIVSAVILGLRVTIDPDLWWHLAVGRHIWTVKAIPYRDLFSFSAPEYPYVYHTWLADLLLFLVHSRLGLWGVSFFYSAFAAIGFWFLAKTAELRNKEWWVYYLVLLFVPLTAWVVEARTQVATFVGLTVIYYIFSLPTEAFHKKIWLIPLLFIVWVNLHGGFFFGLLFLLLLILLKFGETIFHATAADFFARRRLIGNLFLVLLLSLLASLVNPYGHRAYTQAMLIGTNVVNMRLNLDWAPLFSSVVPALFSITMLAGAVFYGLFLVAILSEEKVKWQEKILIGIFFFLTLAARKYVLALMVVLTPAVVVEGRFLYKKYKKMFEEERPVQDLPIKLAVIAVAVTISGVTVRNVWKMQRAYSSEEVYAQEPEPIFTYPYGAVEYMKVNGVPERMFNHLAWGAYLEWHFPEDKFFIDGRMDNFYIDGQPITVDYLTMVNVRPGWQELFDKYRIQAVLGSPTWPLAEVLKLDKSWKLEYVDEASLLLKREQT